ncbi:MAG: hypothetical protein ACO1OB_08000 [Archangium sp.]
MTLKTIQRGATLSKMVAAHNKEFGTRLTVDDVAKANGLKDANKNKAGKQMLFPDKFEKNAPQSVFRNADDTPVVRNGVNETVQVTSQPELISTSNQSVSSNITPRPLEKLPTQPTSTFAPETKTTLSLSEFLAANKDSKLSVDSLRKNGVNAAKSDLNGDGVVSGKNELSSLFATAEKADSNKDKTVADLTNTTVAKNFEGIGAAERMKAAPYSSLDLQRVQTTLKEGTADRLGTVNPENAKKLGLSPGSTEFMVSTPVDETRGLGNRNNYVTIYRDAASGQYFKEYSNDADNKNTPMVPLTDAERELVRNLDSSRLNARGANQERMMTELYSFDGDM